MKLIKTNIPLALALVMALANCSHASSQVLPSQAVDAQYLKAQRIAAGAPLVGALRVTDKAGDHLLVLTRGAGASPARPDSARVEHISLLATYYGRTGSVWTPAWTIRDGVDCPGLDAAAEFVTASIAFTDLNDDGRAEVTVPYRLYCGGGIEPSTVKVILRDGASKLAIRGESSVQVPGQAAFGGEHHYDKALLQPANAAFKRHLDQVWQRVSIDKRN